MTRGEKTVAGLLAVLLGMCFIIVVLGGYVRLTHSGLSIPEWPFFTLEKIEQADGTIVQRQALFPPSEESEWETLRTTFLTDVPPDSVGYVAGVSMADFKRMFWIEWSHRGTAKAIGLVYLFFLAAVFIVPEVRRRMWGKAAAGLVLLVSQAVIGALVVFVHLRAEKIALHLIVAFLFTSLLVWMLMMLLRPAVPAAEKPKGPNPILGTAIAVYVIALIQIFSGGLVAGSMAGFQWNTWPMMGDYWIPPNMMIEDWGLMRNMLENKVVIQFTHRWFAFAVVVAVLYLILRSLTIKVSAPARWALRSVFAIVVLQVILGILTLLMGVQTHLALTHQLVGLILLLNLLVVVYETATQPVLGEEALAELEEHSASTPAKAETANA